jgi:hypothetical protein
MNVLFLGNEHLHQLTAQGKYNLRINMEDFDNNEKYATYKQFAVDDESKFDILHWLCKQCCEETLDIF